MLQRLSLLNFKSWPKLDIELAPLTLLLGPNSSGKTSVLQALLLLKQTAANFDRRQSINYGGTVRDLVDLGSYRSIVYRHESDRRINIGLQWQSSITGNFVEEEEIAQPRLNYEVRWRQLQDRVVIERLFYELEAESGIFFRMKRGNEDKYTFEAPKGTKETRGRYPHLSSPESCYAIPVEIMNSYDSFKPLEFNLQFEHLMSRLTYLGPLRSYPRREYLWTGNAPEEIGIQGENTIEALIASDRARTKRSRSVLIDQVSSWLRRLGLVNRLTVEPIDKERRYYETLVTLQSQSVTNSLLDIGFGVSQVLPVVTLLLMAPEGSIILIEQPELHLHPLAQAELGDLFLEVTQNRGVQLIVETHSEHLLRRLQRRTAERQITPDKLRLYFSSIVGDESQMMHVDIDLFGQIRNWPENFFGDLSGDLDKMMEAAIEYRRKELSNGA